MKLKLIFLSLTILAVACNQNQTKQPIKDAPKDKHSQTSNKVSENHQDSKQTLNLLQGKWQHIEDTSNYLVFEGNYRKETAAGMTEWDIEEFTISDKCLNESDKDNGIETEEAKYMSCLKSDLCWYIIGVDDQNLMLSYMGRGNTLTYKRVK